jgi:hypothetical protein
LRETRSEAPTQGTDVNGAACRRCSHPRHAHRIYAPGGKPAWCTHGHDCRCYAYQPAAWWRRIWHWPAPARRTRAPVETFVLYQRPVRLPIRTEDEDTRLDMPAWPYTPPRGGGRL